MRTGTFSASAVELWDVSIGVAKAFFFGGRRHRGHKAAIRFHVQGRAQAVGQACTEAFVSSFICILALDFALAVISKKHL